MADETKTAAQPEEEPVAEQAKPTAAESAPAEKQEAPKKEKEKKGKKPSELEKLQDDYAALNNRYLRLAAEYDNFRKRSTREREQVWPEATAAAVTKFLGVADNFERGLAAECADTEFKKGMELTFRALSDALSALGVECFGAAGETFDPSRHNAVMHVDDDTLGAQEIVEVFQKGYRIGDKILRYAMVKVAN